MKSTTVFVCNECGYESAKWLGKCPGCNSWNSFYEEKIQKTTTPNGVKEKKRVSPVSLNKIQGEDISRVSTDFKEVDRVLGGGIVKGSLILLRWRAWHWKVYSCFTALSKVS